MSESLDAASVAVEAAAIEVTLRVALGNRALLTEYDRLTGTNLCQRGTALDHAIDEATGRTDADLQGFLAFAKDTLWDRADESTREAVRQEVRSKAREISAR